MALSKSTRILILLAIDSAFFLLELIVGYAVHSLALVADSFHMLNDVLSLCVGLWAVKVANQKTSSKMYTYGWQRAETLGALVNGVFLVALCLSIFLEAIQRFVEPQTVSNPKLVLIVGCFGLASNILGLFLFHDHGHSHGGSGAGHSHNANEGIIAAEEGHSHATDIGINVIGDESGNVADVLPQHTVAAWSKTGNTAKNEAQPAAQQPVGTQDFSKSDEEVSTPGASSPLSMRKTNSNNSQRRYRRRKSASRARHASVDNIHVHPASFRNDIIAASRLEDIDSETGTDSEGENPMEDDEVGEEAPTEASPLLTHEHSHNSGKSTYGLHSSHNHCKPKKGGEKSGGHSHGDLNMKGVFLHVMGDALGNIGVIASALFIWLTSYSWRFYSDPAISLVITVIILLSAVPLCRAASRILLQAVPVGISIDDIKEDIEELPGVISCHHLHVWTLSDTKLVASLHIQVEFDFKSEGSARYMELARAVRTCLHEYGIHSSTIQPEFCLDTKHRHSGLDGEDSPGVDGNRPRPKVTSKSASRTGSMLSTPDACLLDCGDECGDGGQCCSPNPGDSDKHNGHTH